MRPCNNCPFRRSSPAYVPRGGIRAIFDCTFGHRSDAQVIEDDAGSIILRIAVPATAVGVTGFSQFVFNCHKKHKRRVCQGYLSTLMKQSLIYGFELPNHIKRAIIDAEQDTFNSCVEAEKHHSGLHDVSLEKDEYGIPLAKRL